MLNILTLLCFFSLIIFIIASLFYGSSECTECLSHLPWSICSLSVDALSGIHRNIGLMPKLWRERLLESEKAGSTKLWQIGGSGDAEAPTFLVLWLVSMTMLSVIPNVPQGLRSCLCPSAVDGGNKGRKSGSSSSHPVTSAQSSWSPWEEASQRRGQLLVVAHLPQTLVQNGDCCGIRQTLILVGLGFLHCAVVEL